ncbi:MAG: ABC transporter ATP-binding protein [Clostridia bacterium]|nr:ABC transporter ATP-binding protein [Clostridia bacterium]
MKDLLKYLKKYTGEAIIAPLFKLFEALLELAVPIVVAGIIDQGIANGDNAYIVRMCLLLLLMGAVGLAFSLTAQYFSAKAACGFSAELRSALFGKIQSLSYSQLDRKGSATLITRMTGDVNQVQTGVNLTLRLLLRSPFVAFGAMAFAFVVGKNAPRATVTFAVVIPVLLAVIFVILLAGIPIYGKAQGKLDTVTGKLRSNLDGARVIRAFRLEESESEEFSRRALLQKRFQLIAGRISGLLNPLTYVIVNVAIIILLKNGAAEVNSGAITRGELVALYNYMTQILVELIKMANLIITITKALACAKRISSVMNESSDMTVEKRYDVDDFRPFVSFKGVSFAYSGASGEVLSEVDLDAERGELVGIIGGTGSGKSSLVSLIPRFYDVKEGSVVVDGVDVRALEPNELRKRIGFASQHAVLFSGTIRDNIKWGKDDASDDEIYAALSTAQIGELVSQKENGLDSKIEQGGRNLSGGQRQRLNVARALVRRPEILILDDTSSALDRVTDAALRRAVRELDYSPTVFIVSQRVESIKDCDKIAVLDGGRIVGVGSHDELYSDCEIYREICDSQKGGSTI